MAKLLDIEYKDGLKEATYFDDVSDKVITSVTYDSSFIVESNKAAKNSSPEFGRYKKNLVHVGTIHEGDVIRLKNLGYDLLSADQEEYRRALLYIQQNEPHLLTVPGKPFAKKRVTWA